MILPIYTYGMPGLREMTKPVTENSEALQSLIDDMIETMRYASGVGLAAPQVGRTERLFVVDIAAAEEGDHGEGDHGEAAEASPSLICINPDLDFIETPRVEFEEGCLSIPDLRDDVTRPDAIAIRFLDRDLRSQEIGASGLLARVIQHEFDHLNGVLFVDRLSPLRRRLLRRRLREMARGQLETDYPIISPTVQKWQPSRSTN